jgi:hypothetical protein
MPKSAMPYDASDSERAAVARPRSRIRWLASLGLVSCSILAGLLVLELGCRLLRGPEALVNWQNLVLVARVEAMKVDNPEVGSSFSHDDALGFVNTPGYASPRLNFDSQGLRRMPTLPATAVQAPPILATGDSYTMGPEVADDETWTARLQEVLGWRTVNAGVGAYGLDQTVLRTEQLAARLKPAILVVGFIADDVRRTEMSRLWGREKPYFEPAGSGPEGSGLVLRNVPVPPPPDPRRSLSPLQTLFGWSVLLDTVLDRLQGRNEWHMDYARALPAGTGERLACPLMRRLAALGVPTLVVAQYLPSAWDVPQSAIEERRVVHVVLECAERMGLATLDLYRVFDEAIAAGGRAAVYGGWHPNARGSRLTGDAIARELRRRHMLAN